MAHGRATPADLETAESKPALSPLPGVAYREPIREVIMCDKCKVGPGKFEGESALTALAYSSMLNDGADLTEYDAFEHAADFFKAPFNFDADEENVTFARATGFCEDCIAEALEDESHGLSLYEDDNGFLYCNAYATAEEYDTAIADFVAA